MAGGVWLACGAMDDAMHERLGASVDMWRLERETSRLSPRRNAMHSLAAVVLLAATIDPAVAGRAFHELEVMCGADRAALWGRSLCGPTLFVDPRTRTVVAKKDGRITTATLPESIGVANTAVEWNGERWTMVLWPLPDDAIERRRLLAHESFHRIQETLGFPSTGPSNAHLDTLDGRVLLRLEWRALARALGDPARAAESVRDALAFRAARHALTPAAAEEERLLEMHEGLAEWTGGAIAERSPATRSRRIVATLRKGEQSPNLMRSFAYVSGPAWGTLLDLRAAGWSRRLRASDDLARLTARAYGVAAAEDVDALAERYRAAEVITAERQRDTAQQERLRLARARYVDGARLIVPLRQMQMQFDPNGVSALDGVGTVYRGLTLSDAWGTIVAEGGALIASDFQSLIVPAPADANARSGDGWLLTLAHGWRMAPGARAGDFVLVKP